MSRLSEQAESLAKGMLDSQMNQANEYSQDDDELLEWAAGIDEIAIALEIKIWDDDQTAVDVAKAEIERRKTERGAVRKFYVLLGETSIEKIEEAPADANRNALIAWTVADTHREDAYWGRDEHSQPLPIDKLIDLHQPAPNNLVNVLASVGWDGEPAVWLLVEAASEAEITMAWPDAW